MKKIRTEFKTALYLVMLSAIFWGKNIYSDSSIMENLINSCRSKNDGDMPEDAYQKFVRQMDFARAREYCDGLAKDTNNCRSSARFWLGSEAYAKGNFAEAEAYFQEGLDLKNSHGKTKHWISHKEGISGWGNPEDMLAYIKRFRKTGNGSPRYTQKITYLMVEGTDALSGKEDGKQIQKQMDPCLAAHGYLSLNVLKKHLELFSHGLFTIEINPVWIAQTGKKLNQKNYLVLESLSPWDEAFSLQMNQVISESDVIFLAFPRSGGNANAYIGGLPVFQNLLVSPYRTLIQMPSEWLTLINFPQIFHEYMHTVEHFMKQSGMKNFHATSHGEDAKRVQAITNLDYRITGESDWADYFFQNTIPALAFELEKKKAKDGWEQIFGIHISKKNPITGETIKQMFSAVDKKGIGAISAEKKESNILMAEAYTAYNKEKNPAKAAAMALSACEKYPFEAVHYGKAKWFILNSRLKNPEKENLFTRLMDTASKFGIEVNDAKPAEAELN